MIISLATAKAHLRIDGTDSDTILALYIGAAEQSAAEYLNRKLYSDSAELSAAIAAAPGVLAVASAEYDASLAAITTTDSTYTASIAAAEAAYTAAQTIARETRAGMVVNELITAAILLTLTDLFDSRSDTVIGVSVASMPFGSRSLLQPYRREIGI